MEWSPEVVVLCIGYLGNQRLHRPGSITARCQRAHIGMLKIMESSHRRIGGPRLRHFGPIIPRYLKPHIVLPRITESGLCFRENSHLRCSQSTNARRPDGHVVTLQTTESSHRFDVSPGRRLAVIGFAVMSIPVLWAYSVRAVLKMSWNWKNDTFGLGPEEAIRL